MLTALVFILFLGILIYIHEAGHFFAARLSGIKVEEFAFGFPPKLISWKRGETQFAINLIPLGGYVKMLGEGEASNDPRSFSRQPLWVRLVVVLAGVVMNFLLGIGLLWIGFMIGMAPLASDPATLGGTQMQDLLITGVRADSPAARADLRATDVIQGYATPAEFQEFTKTHIGQEVTLTIKRSNELLTKTIQLDAVEEAPLGVGVFQLTRVKLSPLPALKAAFVDVGATVKATAGALGRFEKGLFTSGKVSEEVSGPVGIYKYTGVVVQLGFVHALQLLAGLSISLAFLNVIPVPPLDGGAAVFTILDKLFHRRKAALEQAKAIIYLAGFVFIVGHILIITYKDLIR